MRIRAVPPDGPLSLMGVDCGGIMFPSLDYSDSKQLGSAQRNGQISSSLYPSGMARILRPAESMRSCLKFIQHDARYVCVLVCVCFAAHQNRVSDMVFSLESEWVVSTGHDKSVSWMCTQSGSMLGRHYFNAWASCLQYPLIRQERLLAPR